LKCGQLLKKNDIDFYGLIDLSQEQHAFGAESEIILRKYFPEACQEIKGIADGLMYPYEKFSAWLMCVSICLEKKGCTMLAFKKDNKVFFGRNNDLPPVFRKISNSSLYSPKNGHSFIANSSAFVVAEDGVNEKGLAAGMTFVPPKDIKPGLSSMFFVRYILEKCASVNEGIETIQSMPIAGAWHMILADRNGDIAHAECCADKIRIEKMGAGDSFVIASNHFISNEMKRFENNTNLYNSLERYRTGYDALKNGIDADPAQYVKNILGGKFGFMCQYEKGLDFDTVWSSVYDLNEGNVYRAEGNPKNIQYKDDKRLKFT
jgi:predicted choloylglycine hydrolase